MPDPIRPDFPSSTSTVARRRDGWSEDAVTILTRLWNEGDLSAAVIARRLGVTRNAVLGKVHRLGLSSRRPATARRVAPPAPAPRRPSRKPAGQSTAPSGQADAVQGRWAPQPPIMNPTSAAEDLPGLASRLEDLGPHRCHWPLGDPAAPGFAFCGRRAESGPYCVTHDRRAHRLQPARPLTGLSALLDA